MDSGQGSAQTKQAKKSKKWPKVLLAVVLVASLAGNAFLVFEKLNIGSEQIKTGSICGDEYISKINKIFESTTGGQESFTSLAKEITAKENYQKDPNCGLMVYASYYIMGDFEKAKAEYQPLVDLGNDGLYPSLKINFSMPYELLKKNLETSTGSSEGVRP